MEIVKTVLSEVDRFSQKGLNEGDSVLLILKVDWLRNPGRPNGSSARESSSPFANAHDDDAHVVLAAMIIREEHELIRAGLRVRRVK